MDIGTEVGSGLCVVLSQSRTDIDFQVRDDGLSSVMGRKQTQAPVMGTPRIYMLGDRRHLGRHLGRRQYDSGAFLAELALYSTGLGCRRRKGGCLQKQGVVMTLWHPDKRISRWLSWIGQFDASADWVTRTVPGCPTKKQSGPCLAATHRVQSPRERGYSRFWAGVRCRPVSENGDSGRNSYEECVRWGCTQVGTYLCSSFFGRILRELFGLETGRSLSYFVLASTVDV